MHFKYGYVPSWCIVASRGVLRGRAAPDLNESVVNAAGLAWYPDEVGPGESEDAPVLVTGGVDNTARLWSASGAHMHPCTSTSCSTVQAPFRIFATPSQWDNLHNTAHPCTAGLLLAGSNIAYWAQLFSSRCG